MAVVTIPSQSKRIDQESDVAAFLRPFGIRYER